MSGNSQQNQQLKQDKYNKMKQKYNQGNGEEQLNKISVDYNEKEKQATNEKTTKGIVQSQSSPISKKQDYFKFSLPTEE